MRQIVLDTETTGLDPKQGHRLIEIGCIELIDRRVTDNSLHLYINPQRDIDEGALAVHGITTSFLQDKPEFSAVASQIFDYLNGAELIIHNAAFDLGFLDHEFSLQNYEKCITDSCDVIDTLKFAREKHPGQRNSLDALCKRYDVDNTNRQLHGALLDSELLARVYLKMTGGQISLFSSELNQLKSQSTTEEVIKRLPAQRDSLLIIAPSFEEQRKHDKILNNLKLPSWTTLDG